MTCNSCNVGYTIFSSLQFVVVENTFLNCKNAVLVKLGHFFISIAHQQCTQNRRAKTKHYNHKGVILHATPLKVTMQTSHDQLLNLQTSTSWAIHVLSGLD